MTTRSLDSSHDLSFGKGKSNYLSESEEIKQNIKTRILQWLGDCYFALDEGVDWNRHLENNQTDLLAEDIKRVIVETYGVGQLTSFEFSLEDRNFKASYTIVDIYSNTWFDTTENIDL